LALVCEYFLFPGNSDHPLDEKDRLDHMHRDPAMISSVGPPPYSQDADRLNQTAPGESHADRPGYHPGDAEDRLDKEQDQVGNLTDIGVCSNRHIGR